jgi:hypothetical protein
MLHRLERLNQSKGYANRELSCDTHKARLGLQCCPLERTPVRYAGPAVDEVRERKAATSCNSLTNLSAQCMADFSRTLFGHRQRDATELSFLTTFLEEAPARMSVDLSTVPV